MENSELQRIWKTLDAGVNQRSEEELNLLLASKARQVYNEFLIVNLTAVPVCAGVLVWLIFSTANRLNDGLYVANNMILGTIVLFAFVYGISEWKRFKRNKRDKPVKDWLEREISLLSKWLVGKYQRIDFYLVPVLYMLTFLSFHVYYSGLYFKDVFRSEKFLEEDMWGIIIFTPILFAGLFYSLIKLRRHQVKKLQFLKDLHNRLCNVS